MNLSGSMGSAKALINEFQVAGCKTAFQSPLQGTAQITELFGGFNANAKHQIVECPRCKLNRISKTPCETVCNAE